MCAAKFYENMFYHKLMLKDFMVNEQFVCEFNALMFDITPQCDQCKDQNMYTVEFTHSIAVCVIKVK